MSKALIKRLRIAATWERRKRPLYGVPLASEAADLIERQSAQIDALSARLRIFRNAENAAESASVAEIAGLPPEELKATIGVMIDDSRAKTRLLEALREIESLIDIGMYYKALEEVDRARGWAILRGPPEVAAEIKSAREDVFFPRGIDGTE